MGTPTVGWTHDGWSGSDPLELGAVKQGADVQSFGVGVQRLSAGGLAPGGGVDPGRFQELLAGAH